MVTGEAVALELRPANVVIRLLGGLVDLGLYSVAGLAVLIASSRFVDNQAQFNALLVSVIAMIMVVIPTTVETFSRGLSAGKLAVGLRIVRDDGGAVRFRQALVRSIVGIAEIWLTFGGLAVITAIINKRSKRLGDLLAGTYSVEVRGTESALMPLLMPAELAGWARIADIRELPDQLAVHARMYLGRTGALNDSVRSQVGRQFASALEQYVAPPPPWGTHPERFIAAVLVARRDREYRSALVSQRRDAHTAQRIRQLPFGVADYR